MLQSPPNQRSWQVQVVSRRTVTYRLIERAARRLLLAVIGLLVLERGCVSDRLQEAVVVESPDPFQRREFHILVGPGHGPSLWITWRRDVTPACWWMARRTRTRCAAVSSARSRCSWRRLMSYPMVAERVEDGRLALYGWHYGLELGEVRLLDVEHGAFRPVA